MMRNWMTANTLLHIDFPSERFGARANQISSISSVQVIIGADGIILHNTTVSVVLGNYVYCTASINESFLFNQHCARLPVQRILLLRTAVKRLTSNTRKGAMDVSTRLPRVVVLENDWGVTIFITAEPGGGS
jgi:hypothetical protein